MDGGIWSRVLISFIMVAVRRLVTGLVEIAFTTTGCDNHIWDGRSGGDVFVDASNFRCNNYSNQSAKASAKRRGGEYTLQSKISTLPILIDSSLEYLHGLYLKPSFPPIIYSINTH